MKSQKNNMESCIINTPLGFAKLEGDSSGISSLTVLNNETFESNTITETLEDAAHQLKEYFKGERTDFSLKLNPQGTDFQKRVWAELLNIPYGRTISYSEIAIKIGNPDAVRAVGLANKNNPIAIIVPCHRVIGKNGDLTGYFYGLDTKRQLLELENPLSFSRQGSLF